MSEFIIKSDKNDKSYTLASDIDGDMVFTIAKHGNKNGDFYTLEVATVDAESNPYAHAIKSHTTLYVKVGENGKLFNPYGLFSEGMEKKQRVGRPTWKFRSVSRAIFNNYVRFLSTRNETFLRNAEREMI